ncbi:MAG: protein kinase [Planctomycetota bacterium]
MSDDSISDDVQRTDSHRCPGCGVDMNGQGPDAACPACLMSGVLRFDAETAPIDSESRTQTIGPDVGDGRGMTPPADLPCELGAYTLVSLLGRGGMGTVYEAIERSSGRRLALKLLAQSLDSPEMRKRFLREGRLAARVNHPSSLYVFGSEEIEGVPVITMEIASGGTLQDAIDRRGPLPVSEAVDAVLGMIDGLEAALDRGVLHRDIKPSNCFLSPDGTVKVGDFGLSVSTLPTNDSFATQTGRVMGTPAFASPEQLRGDEVDARSDIYAVGATLFTLLTAQAPFKGENAVQVVANVIDTPPADVTTIQEDVPPALSRVIARCLAKEPGGRYASYATLRNALLPFSSVVPEPATQTQRTAAGWIDYLAAFLPAYAAMMITVGPVTLFVKPLYELTFDAWKYQLLVFAVGMLYFAVTEGTWGAGLGKRIVGLRVVTTAGRSVDVGRALLRIMIPIAAIECLRVPLSIATLPSGEWTGINALVFTALSIACPWVVALLWIPARRSNGFATAWDLATRTRVVVRPRGTRRPVASGMPGASQTEGSGLSFGPFEIGSDIEPGAWLSGHDPVLRRPVWLTHRAGPELSEARRAAARPGRARWLQSINLDGRAWDAFDAPRGVPLGECASAGPVRWSAMRHWLHDLAAEFRAAEREGTLGASISLDHVWITSDGGAMLLDRPWPNVAEDAEPMPIDDLAGQQRFLRAVADHVDPLSVPLHAQPALHNLRSGSFEKLTYLAGTLRGLLNKPAEVSRGLRCASLLVIPGYAAFATFLGIAANTDPTSGAIVWAGRAAIAVLVMMHFMALFDVILAFWHKSTGLSTFGLEAVTEHGRASRARLLARAAVMWLPVVVPTVAIAIAASARGTWISFDTAAMLGGIVFVLAAVVAASAIVNATRGLHDRIAGVWIGRR